jgi:hypothetical protein
MVDACIYIICLYVHVQPTARKLIVTGDYQGNIR